MTYLKVEEVASKLACSEGTVRKLIRDQHLPAIKLGRDYRVEEKDIALSLSNKNNKERK